jgi:hypothetical protein
MPTPVQPQVIYPQQRRTWLEAWGSGLGALAQALQVPFSIMHAMGTAEAYERQSLAPYLDAALKNPTAAKEILQAGGVSEEEAAKMQQAFLETPYGRQTRIEQTLYEQNFPGFFSPKQQQVQPPPQQTTGGLQELRNVLKQQEQPKGVQPSQKPATVSDATVSPTAPPYPHEVFPEKPPSPNVPTVVPPAPTPPAPIAPSIPEGLPKETAKVASNIEAQIRALGEKKGETLFRSPESMSPDELEYHYPSPETRKAIREAYVEQKVSQPVSPEVLKEVVSSPAAQEIRDHVEYLTKLPAFPGFEEPLGRLLYAGAHRALISGTLSQFFHDLPENYSFTIATLEDRVQEVIDSFNAKLGIGPGAVTADEAIRLASIFETMGKGKELSETDKKFIQEEVSTWSPIKWKAALQDLGVLSTIAANWQKVETERENVKGTLQYWETRNNIERERNDILRKQVADEYNISTEKLEIERKKLDLEERKFTELLPTEEDRVKASALMARAQMLQARAEAYKAMRSPEDQAILRLESLELAARARIREIYEEIDKHTREVIGSLEYTRTSDPQKKAALLNPPTIVGLHKEVEELEKYVEGIHQRKLELSERLGRRLPPVTWIMGDDVTGGRLQGKAKILPTPKELEAALGEGAGTRDIIAVSGFSSAPQKWNDKTSSFSSYEPRVPMPPGLRDWLWEKVVRGVRGEFSLPTTKADFSKELTKVIQAREKDPAKRQQLLNNLPFYYEEYYYMVEKAKKLKSLIREGNVAPEVVDVFSQ